MSQTYNKYIGNYLIKTEYYGNHTNPDDPERDSVFQKIIIKNTYGKFKEISYRRNGSVKEIWYFKNEKSHNFYKTQAVTYYNMDVITKKIWCVDGEIHREGDKFAIEYYNSDGSFNYGRYIRNNNNVDPVVIKLEKRKQILDGIKQHKNN